MQPIVHSLLTQLKEFTHEDLQRIRLEIDQQEQQLLFWEMQYTMTTSARKPLAGTASQRLMRGVQPIIGATEGCQENLKLLQRQTREGEKPTPILSKF